MFGRNKQEKDNVQPDAEYFTIYDTKVGVYRDPIMAVNQFDLLRQIDSDFRKPEIQQGQMFLNAEDFQLFKIGDYSKRTGQIYGHEPIHIANLHEIKSAVLRSTKKEIPRDVTRSDEEAKAQAWPHIAP